MQRLFRTIGILFLLTGTAPVWAVPPVPCDTNAGACWTPAPQTRWQYQLEGKRNRYLATGGINVDICYKPFTGGACVTPDVFDIDLYVDSNISGEGVFVVNTAAVAGAVTPSTPAATPSATCRRATSRPSAPTTRPSSTSTPSAATA